MSYTIPFSKLSLNDVMRGGGKAVSLAYMKQHGINVPSGFVVSTEAFTAFRDNKLSHAFKQELLDSFKELNADFVAVRSSAIVEDGSNASWAGQLESYLNVTDGNLIDSVQKCWKSINSSHVSAYAKNKNLSDDDMKVAVVVQSMVKSEVSGVMFTVNPISRDSNQMIIESIYGLGEMIVSGMVTPDSYLLTKQPLEVIDVTIQIKTEQMIYEGSRNKVVPVPERLADKATLNEAEVNELARIGLNIERLYGSPQDIEWARANGVFFIVQARPITTL